MKIEKWNWSSLGVRITSGDGEDDRPGCALVANLFRWYVRIDLPQIISPAQRRVAANWDATTVARIGRDYWIDYTKREYGFSLSDGHLCVYLGRQSHDSATEQMWSCFLPWTQWRHVRFSLYGLSGERAWTQYDRSTRGDGMARYQAQLEAEKAVPKAVFRFRDFDGEEITATTHIEEREWHFGTKWCSWLSIFRQPRVRRYLDIEFSAETGREKGSWKGGTMGHSIELRPGELHESAFRRYCAEHEMTFLAK